MKKNFFILISVFIISSCIRESKKDEESYPKYDIGYQKVIPDSNKMKMAEWITKTVSASNKNLSAGDYEDPEDVIKQCEKTAEKIFSVEEPYLQELNEKNGHWHSTDLNKLNKKQKKILDSLLQK